MVGLCLKGVNSLPAYEIGAKEGLNRIGERWGCYHLSLSRLNLWLPRGQADPEVMQGTADFHYDITNAPLPRERREIGGVSGQSHSEARLDIGLVSVRRRGVPAGAGQDATLR